MSPSEGFLFIPLALKFKSHWFNLNNRAFRQGKDQELDVAFVQRVKMCGVANSSPIPLQTRVVVLWNLKKNFFFLSERDYYDPKLMFLFSPLGTSPLYKTEAAIAKFWNW